MGSIRLIVSDFDGTLVPYGETELSAGTRGLLEELTEAGVTLAIASGRTYGELRERFGPMAEGLYFLCCDGAYTRKGARGLYERQIGREDLGLFFRHLREREDFSFVLHGAERNYGAGALPREAAVFTPVAIGDAGALREKIYKVTAYGGSLRLPARCGLRTHWDGGPRSMAQYVNRFANKGAALSDLLTRLMLTGFDTACIGDGGNDLPLMRGVKRSFCVGTRDPRLAEVCTDRVATADEALRRLLAESKSNFFS